MGSQSRAPRRWRRCTRPPACSTTSCKAEGAWVFAGGLHPANTATVVKVQDGEVITTDGPFAESKEQLGGFWIVKAANLDEALALAVRGSIACGAPVEVRPFQAV